MFVWMIASLCVCATAVDLNLVFSSFPFSPSLKEKHVLISEKFSYFFVDFGAFWGFQRRNAFRYFEVFDGNFFKSTRKLDVE